MERHGELWLKELLEHRSCRSCRSYGEGSSPRWSPDGLSTTEASRGNYKLYKHGLRLGVPLVEDSTGTSHTVVSYLVLGTFLWTSRKRSTRSPAIYTFCYCFRFFRWGHSITKLRDQSQLVYRNAPYLARGPRRSHTLTIHYSFIRFAGTLFLDHGVPCFFQYGIRVCFICMNDGVEPRRTTQVA